MTDPVLQTHFHTHAHTRLMSATFTIDSACWTAALPGLIAHFTHYNSYGIKNPEVKEFYIASRQSGAVNNVQWWIDFLSVNDDHSRSDIVDLLHLQSWFVSSCIAAACTLKNKQALIDIFNSQVPFIKDIFALPQSLHKGGLIWRGPAIWILTDLESTRLAQEKTGFIKYQNWFDDILLLLKDMPVECYKFVRENLDFSTKEEKKHWASLVKDGDVDVYFIESALELEKENKALAAYVVFHKLSQLYSTRYMEYQFYESLRKTKSIKDIVGDIVKEKFNHAN